MAKAQIERTKKSKTPAQLAKKAENERLAAERLVKLQARQKLVFELRKTGQQGSDHSILAAYDAREAEAAKARLAAEKAANDALAQEQHRIYKEKVVVEQKKYVENALDGPSAIQLKEWLQDKPATFKAVEKFFKISGLPRTEAEAAKNVEVAPVVEG